MFSEKSSKEEKKQKNPVNCSVCKTMIIDKLYCLDFDSTIVCRNCFENKRKCCGCKEKKSTMSCGCKQYCCYDCAWVHYSPGGDPNHFKDLTGLNELPGKTLLLEAAKVKYAKLSSINFPSINVYNRKIHEYNQTKRNSYADEISLAIKTLTFSDIPGYVLDVEEVLVLAEMYFKSGFTRAGLNNLKLLNAYDLKAKSRGWILILNYIGYKHFQPINTFINEISGYINENNEFTFDYYRLYVLYSILNSGNVKEATKNYLKQFKKMTKNLQISDKSLELRQLYYIYLDEFYYLQDYKNFKYFNRAMHFTDIFFTSSIILSNLCENLSDYFSTIPNYPEACKYMEMSVEKLIEGNRTESEDMVLKIFKLVKYKSFLNAYGIEHLLGHAIRVSEKNNMKQELLQGYKLLQSYYLLQGNTLNANKLQEQINLNL
jgi:hypothetical protein